MHIPHGMTKYLLLQNLPVRAESSVFIHSSPPLSKAGVFFLCKLNFANPSCGPEIFAITPTIGTPTDSQTLSAAKPSGHPKHLLNHWPSSNHCFKTLPPPNTAVKQPTYNFLPSRSDGRRSNDKYKRSASANAGSAGQALPACEPGQLPGEKTRNAAADCCLKNSRGPNVKVIRQAHSPRNLNPLQQHRPNGWHLQPDNP